MLLAEKYRPKKLGELAGNSETIQKISKWALLWEQGKRGQPLLLHGAVGTGKTSVAHALANELGWELLEMNASGLRDEESVERIAGAASSSSSLSGRRKLILIDDVDGLQPKEDKGGAGAIAKLLENSRQPLILTCHDVWDKKLAGIRGSCTKLEFKKINAGTIAAALRKIVREERLNAGEELVAKISSLCGGDLRSAINDLQASNASAERDREKSIFETIRQIFRSSTYAEARRLGFDSGEEPRTLRLWIDENIPNEYETLEEIAASYSMLSRADIFDGRISRRQHYGFLRYANDLATAGVALSRSGTGAKFTTYSFPSYLRSMGATKGSRAMRKALGAKLGKPLHCSARDAQEYFALLAGECTKDIASVKSLYGLEDAELAFLLGSTEKDIEKMLEAHERKGKKEGDEKPAKGKTKNPGTEEKIKTEKEKPETNEKNKAGNVQKNEKSENPRDEKITTTKGETGIPGKNGKTKNSGRDEKANEKPVACKLSDFC